MRWKEFLTLRMLEKNKTWISEIKEKKTVKKKKAPTKFVLKDAPEKE